MTEDQEEVNEQLLALRRKGEYNSQEEFGALANLG